MRGQISAGIPILRVDAPGNGLLGKITVALIQHKAAAERQRKPMICRRCMRVVDDREHAFLNEVRRDITQRFTRFANIVVGGKRRRTMALAAFPAVVDKPFAAAIQGFDIRSRIPCGFCVRQLCGQFPEQIAKALFVFAGVRQIVRAAFNGCKSHVQVHAMFADEPILQLVFERMQNRLCMLRVRQQHICMAATRVHDVRAIQRQALEQLVDDVLHHELKVQASRAQLLKRLRPADVVDEVLDAAHVAGGQQEHRLGVVRARRLS